jgi:hypothetical protein
LVPRSTFPGGNLAPDREVYLIPKLKEMNMQSILLQSAFAAALLGAAAFFPAASFALDDDVDVEIETDRDRPGILPGEPLDDPDADIYVETPDVDADADARLDTDDDADIEVEAD